VDHHFLALEGGVEVRDNPDLPRLAEPERLRRRAVLAPGVEGTALELLARRRLDAGAAAARAPRAARRDYDLSSR
jgi:hypothetical protein